ncbi:MAG: hypothetical protein MJ239_03115 [Bacilli bacterium]|nr:hypothetical protein [Bacilli bacterium]
MFLNESEENKDFISSTVPRDKEIFTNETKEIVPLCSNKRIVGRGIPVISLNCR